MSIYFDNASTTPVAPEVRAAMEPYLRDLFFNPSSVYSDGRSARAAIEQARGSVAEAIGAPAESIILTSGGTEADNAAVKGVAFAKGKGHIITTAAEHHAVLSACEWLEKRGFSLTVLPVDDESRAQPEALEAAMRPDTILVSCIWTNNETGAVNPIKELAAIAHAHGALFHADAVQALPVETIDVQESGVDLLSLSGHKIYAPKGCGALFCKKGVALEPLLHGGQQESRRRGGTEAVPAVAALGAAAKLLKEEREARRAHVRALKEAMLGELQNIDGVRVNGSAAGSPAILNVGFADVQAEALVLMLDHSGVRVSMGAACDSRSVEPSHVLRAMRVPKEYLGGSIRISFSKFNTFDEIAQAAEVLRRAVARHRA